MFLLSSIISAETTKTEPIVAINKKLDQSSYTKYISHSRETLKRLLFGVHSKTKRSLAEEAESGDELSVGSWIRDGADPNEQDTYGYTPLLNASANGRLKAVKNLIKNGAEINKTGPFGYTALHAAAQNGHQEIVSFLLENGADINAQNDDKDTSLHLALREQRLEIVNVLIKHKCNPHIEGFNSVTGVQCARDFGLNDIAELLHFNVN